MANTQTFQVALLMCLMGSARSGDCACFSTCNARGARQFLQFLPDAVRSTEDPYYAYLKAVYGTDVELPFQLSTVNFFYHNDAEWRTEHPGVDWPMASCSIPKALLPAHPINLGTASQPLEKQPWCHQNSCMQWKRPDPVLGPKLTLVIIPSENGHNSTSGAVLFEQPSTPSALLGRKLRGRQAHPNNTWIEVIRFAKAEEDGTNSWYGSWFFHAIGSGIYLNTNMSFVLFDKRDQHGLHSLTRGFVDDHASHRLAFKQDAQLARRARSAGYQTVQILDGMFGMTELVASTSTLVEVLRPVRGCALVTYRTGWRGSLPCHCLASRTVLNCAGWSFLGSDPAETGKYRSEEVQRRIIWPSAGVISLIYVSDQIRQKGPLTPAVEATHAARVLRNVMKPRYPMLVLCNTKAVDVLGGIRMLRSTWDDARILNTSAHLYAHNLPDAHAVSKLLSPMSRAGAMVLKLYAYLQSPFDRSLFLDTDVFVLQPSLVDSLLMHTLELADLAAPVDPAHTTPPATHAPLLCMGLAAFRSNDVTRRLFAKAVVRMGKRRETQRTAAGGLARNGDQEAIYEEWTQGRHANLRVVPLTEEYYCPQVKLNAGGRSATWSTSWTDMGKHAPYPCKAVHGHDYVRQLAAPLLEIPHDGLNATPLAGFTAPRWPHNTTICTSRRGLLFVSAFRNIGRDHWSSKRRSVTDYAGHFSILLHSLRQGQYDLVLYINPSLAHQLAINATSRITLIPFSQVRQSIYSSYLHQEQKIMATSKYKSLIPASLRDKPEFSRAEYTMVNHDKIALLNDAAERSPGYSHVAWIDFGAIRSRWYAPGNIDLCKLPSHKVLVSSADTIIDEFEPVSPFDMFNQQKTFSPETGTYTSRFPKDPICGTILFFPRELIPRIRNLYEAELRRWQALGIAHYDQAMWLQLHKASNGSLFHLWSPPTCVKGGLLRCRTIFPYYLNHDRAVCK